MRLLRGGRTMIRVPATSNTAWPLDGTIVDKTHIPYELSPQKLERIRRTFAASHSGT